MAKRLQKELKEFRDEPKNWCKVEILKDDNLFLWRAEIVGPVFILTICKFFHNEHLI